MSPISHRLVDKCLFCLVLIVELDGRVARADEPGAAASVSEHVKAEVTEPLATSFSMKLAARSLDESALDWQKTNQCCQCHANLMYLVARPALRAIVTPPNEVRDLFESLVRDRWETKGLRYPSEAMVVAVPMAFNDRATSGTLHPLTRKALDRMLTFQRADGGWAGIGGSPRTFINEFEETLFAALGIAVAPGEYARTEPASRALGGIRKYVAAHPPRIPYQRAMLLWASHYVDGLMTDSDRDKAVQELLALQRSDGGCTLQELLEDDRDWQRGRFARGLSSDGYGTGFVIFTLRQAGVPANAESLQRGIKWLKANQRASGRWFTPTASRRTLNLPSNSGTGYAILALQACGEIPSPE